MLRWPVVVASPLIENDDKFVSSTSRNSEPPMRLVKLHVCPRKAEVFVFTGSAPQGLGPFLRTSWLVMTYFTNGKYTYHKKDKRQASQLPQNDVLLVGDAYLVDARRDCAGLCASGQHLCSTVMSALRYQKLFDTDEAWRTGSCSRKPWRGARFYLIYSHFDKVK